MSSRHPPSSSTNSNPASKPGAGSPAFYTQREALVNDIAFALDQVLGNINKLNRSLEGTIAVGNEFGNVEALWSQFEGVMAKDEEKEGKERGDEDEDEEEGEGEEEEEEQARDGVNRSTSRQGR